VITVAGRITPEKGLAVLVEALGAVQDSPPIELRIAGVVEHGARPEVLAGEHDVATEVVPRPQAVERHYAADAVWL